MAFSDPQHILEAFGLHEGQKVADLGAGSGFYTIEAAKMVGQGGHVYAFDVQADLLTRLHRTASEAKLHNVSFVHANIEQPGGTKLKDGLVDVALVCNVLFQIEHKDAFIEEVKRILRVDGRVLVIEWSDSFGGLGPQPEHVVTYDKTREYFTKHGFVEVSMTEAGDHHYGFIFRKS